MAFDQYHLSLVSRRDAWLAAATLPKGLYDEGKGAELVIPSINNPHEERLCLLGHGGVQSICEHFQMEDRAIMNKCMNPPSNPSNRGRARGRARGGGQHHPRSHTQSVPSERYYDQNQSNRSHRSPPKRPRDERERFHPPRGQGSFCRSHRGKRY